MDRIPDELGVFPLPHVVLFPNALLPLHVFEHRYRALLRDALAGSSRFVMAVTKSDVEGGTGERPELHRHACVGRIVEHQPLPDGRSDLILQGERVAEIRSVVATEPYRSVRIRCYPEDAAFVEGPGARDRVLELRRLLEDACPGCIAALKPHMSADLEDAGGLTLLHTIAMHLPVGVSKKLEWLACPDSLARWLLMRETLREMGRARAVRKRAIVRYGDLMPENPKVN